jgi:hypothetical protein
LDDIAHLGRVYEITIETVDARDEIKEYFNVLNPCAQRLRRIKQRKIDPRTDAMPAVAWQLLAVHQNIVYRTVELQNALSVLLNAQNFLSVRILIVMVV